MVVNGKQTCVTCVGTAGKRKCKYEEPKAWLNFAFHNLAPSWSNFFLSRNRQLRYCPEYAEMGRGKGSCQKRREGCLSKESGPVFLPLRWMGLKCDMEAWWSN